MIDVLILAAVTDRSNGEIYNVGYGKPITFKRFIKLIADKTGVKINNRQWPKKQLLMEAGDYYSDISKIKKHLSWKPKVSFEEGINLSLSQK